MKSTFRNSTLAAATAAVILTGSIASAQVTATTTSTTTTAGMVSEAGPDSITVRTETSTEPVRYSFSQSTTYVDEAGAPVSRELVRSGLPVTVHYIRDGERLVADRVIVRRQTTTTAQPAPTVIERNTTITKPPVVIERQVDRPVVVEKKVPVIVEKKVPVYVDRPVEKKVYVDRPVVVEKRVKPATEAIVEERTTTTTTTTGKK